jgi:hypothetical protein
MATPGVDPLSLIRQTLERVAADLTALKAFASTQERLPDRQDNVDLFYRSAQRGCVVLQTFFSALHDLVHPQEGHRAVYGQEDCAPGTWDRQGLREQAEQLQAELAALAAQGDRKAIRKVRHTLDVYERRRVLRVVQMRAAAKIRFPIIEGEKG